MFVFRPHLNPQGFEGQFIHALLGKRKPVGDTNSGLQTDGTVFGTECQSKQKHASLVGPLAGFPKPFEKGVLGFSISMLEWNHPYNLCVWDAYVQLLTQCLLHCFVFCYRDSPCVVHLSVDPTPTPLSVSLTASCFLTFYSSYLCGRVPDSEHHVHDTVRGISQPLTRSLALLLVYNCLYIVFSLCLCSRVPDPVHHVHDPVRHAALLP